MLQIDLSGKTAVVTGGSRGVGAGICKVLATCGANVIINYQSNEEAALNVKRGLFEIGTKAEIFKANVTNPEEVKAMYEFAEKTFGSLDIVVNNAGVSTRGSLEQLSYDEISKVIDTNVKGVFTCSKEALPFLKKQASSRIINIGSTSMYTGGGGGAHYAASKAALMGLTRNMAKEYAKFGLTTNTLAISLIDTELFRNRYPDPKDREKAISTVPVGRAGTPEDIGYITAFLASELSSYINGVVFDIDGDRLYG